LVDEADDRTPALWITLLRLLLLAAPAGPATAGHEPTSGLGALYLLVAAELPEGPAAAHSAPGKRQCICISICISICIGIGVGSTFRNGSRERQQQQQKV
jgi:hypothetical protein